jgi:hypothetical protein
MIKLFGITADFWKNKYSSDSHLIITLDYNKEGNIKNLVLKTVIISEYKTGGTYKTSCKIHFIF